MAVAFLILFVLAFIGIVGWQTRDDYMGGSPNKPLAMGIFTVVILIFFLIVRPWH